VVEAVGDGVLEALAALPGVSGHSSQEVEGRVRVELESSGASELRPDIFGLALDRGWTLWELHREQANLEQLFRSLTADEPGASGGFGSDTPDVTLQLDEVEADE
jgi:hypothetical protein